MLQYLKCMYNNMGLHRLPNIQRTMLFLKSCVSRSSSRTISHNMINKNVIVYNQRTFAILFQSFPNIFGKNITFKNAFATSKLLHDLKQHKEVEQQDHNYNTYTYRTHTCGELRTEHEGLKVTLCGWVQFLRLSKFLLLRDGYGLTQCVVGEKSINISDLPLETIVRIEGSVTRRPMDTINKNMATGDVEVVIDKLEVLNTADKLPFNLRDYQKPKEQLRLQHRYIDLRFPEMQSNLRLRSQILHNMRKFLVEKQGFVEVETPTLFCQTPGGAREFLVPTHYAGLFYSLVQSPQQFKQMLMSGGIDRYFQIARCYRDETTRPDRQPEFTQLDIELSFTNLEGILSMIEQLLFKTFNKPLPKPPFKRITYKEALENYGSDKPNLAYDLKFVNLKHLFLEKFKNNDYAAYGLPYTNNIGKLTAKYRENIRELSKKYNCKVILNENISKELGTEINEQIKNNVGLSNSVIISIGEVENSAQCLGEIRQMLAPLLVSNNLLVIKQDVEPLWVVDFPLFLKGNNGLETCHHPFTAPHPDDIHLIDTEPLKVRSLAYDIVINGNEIGGGSVRIHCAGLQEKIMKILNIDPAKMTHFLNALKYGCPPHAGIALGIDRLISLACNAESIREVIAFPKSHDGTDPLSGAPNTVSDDYKKYYHIVSVDR